MATLKKIAFAIDDFKPGSPGQRLLDRFLIGFAANGAWTKPPNRLIAISIPDEEWNAELDRRVHEFGLRRTGSLKEALQDADGVVVAGKAAIGNANDVKNKFIVQHTPKGCPIFVYGALGQDPGATGSLFKIANNRGIPICSGTTLRTAWRLPELQLPAGAKLKRALAIVPGEFPTADFLGLEAALPFSGIRAVPTKRREVGAELIESELRWMFNSVNSWHTVEDVADRIDGEGWGNLAAAALSRSSSPLGTSVTDGRTQDLSSTSTFASMAKDARLIQMVEIDGYRTGIIVVNGVINDIVFAVETDDGTIKSAKIHIPPEPARSDFDRLAEALEGFFATGEPPWDANESFHQVNLLGLIRYHRQVFSSQKEKQAAKPSPDSPSKKAVPRREN